MEITPHVLMLSLTLSVALMGQAFGQSRNDGVDPSITEEKQIQTFVVEKNGSFSASVEEVRLINQERGIKLVAQRQIAYNVTLEKLEIVEAFTEKPDGRKIAVAPDRIKEQQEARSTDAPMFQDTRIKVIIFPDVAVGDRIKVRYKRTRLTPLFPGHFDDVTVPTFHPHGEMLIIYDLPAEMHFAADARGFSETVSAGATGRVLHRWVYKDSPKARPERNAVSYFDDGDRLIVSTFNSYPDIGAAYLARSGDKTTATARIRELAAQITGQRASEREKVLALTDWVRKNIRYVAVYIGAGGVVPHNAESVLDNRYGDCKDHVVLLEALLSAVNIDSTGALINLGSIYLLPKVATVRVFNHIITFVPFLNLYVDSTAEAISPGYLVPLELDKPVLLVKSGSIARTPATQAGSTRTTVQYVVDTDGNASFENDQIINGNSAEINRYVMRSMTETDRSNVVARLLHARQLKGGGTVDVGDVRGTGDSYSLKLKGRIDNLVSSPGMAALPVLTGLGGDINSYIGTLTSEKQRTQRFICPQMDAEEEAVITLPPQFDVMDLPKGVSVNAGMVSYESQYRKTEGGISVTRTFNFKNDRTICSPLDYEAMVPALNDIQKDLRRQILIRSSS